MSNPNAPPPHQGNQNVKGGRIIVFVILLLTVIIIVANHVFGFLQNSLTNDLVVVGVAIAMLTVLFEQAEIRKILHIPTAGVGEKIRASLKAIIMGIRRSWRWVSLPLNIFLIGVLIFVYHAFDPQLTPTSCDICIQTIEGQPIGISDGRYVFDMRQNISPDSDKVPDGVQKSLTEKKEGAKYMPGDPGQAAKWFAQAMKDDASDAETHIYYQNAQLLASNQPYAIIVVSATLTVSPSPTTGQADLSSARTVLQGLALEQERVNTGGMNCLIPQGTDCLRLYLMIANLGKTSINSKNGTNTDVYADQVVKQIINLKQDKGYKNFVGVVGWPISTDNTITGIRKLGDANILTVSPTASTDALTGISPYFFRVVPPNTEQGIDAAQYVEKQLHIQHVALFMDQNNTYSRTLANSFYKQFAINDQNKVILETYTHGQLANLAEKASDAHKRDPQLQLIYFSGYSEDFDGLRTTLGNTQTYPWVAKVKMMGGDALSNSGGFQQGYKAFLMTAFAFPDTWDILRQQDPTPFSGSYAPAFGATWSGNGNPYGYTRPDSRSILSYDAVEMLRNAVVIAHAQSPDKPLTMSDMQQVLFSPTSNSTYQGVSGQIRPGLSGDPINKAVVLLCVDSNRETHLAAIYGDFLLGDNPQEPQTFASDCS